MSTIIIILYCTCDSSFSKYLLSAYNIPGTFLNAGDVTINKNRSRPMELLYNLDRGNKRYKSLNK